MKGFSLLLLWVIQSGLYMIMIDASNKKGK